MVKTEAEWANDVKHLLRAEMARRGVTYDQLTEKLAQIGVVGCVGKHSQQGRARKFTAVFLVQALRAIGCDLTTAQGTNRFGRPPRSGATRRNAVTILAGNGKNPRFSRLLCQYLPIWGE